MPFLSDHQIFRPGFLRGFVMHTDQPGRNWQVGLFRGDTLLGCCLSDLHTDPACDWPAFYGFEFNLQLGALEDDAELRLQVVNTDHVIARLQRSDLERGASSEGRRAAGFVRHVQGLTLTGTIDNGVTDLPSFEIVAMEDDRIVGRSRFWRWQHVGAPDNPLGRAAAFDLLLDPALADGRLHAIHVETSTGVVLDGSPVDLIAWPNRLREQLLTEALDGQHDANRRQGDQMLERLLGLSMPLSAYAALYPTLGQVDDSQSLAVGAVGSDGAWRRLGATGWLLCYHQAVEPTPDLEHLITQALDDDPAPPQLIFWDLGVRQADGLIFPLLFPAFDLERLIEQGYGTLCFALPETALAMIERAASLSDLLMGVVLPGRCALRRTAIIHIPHPGGVISEKDLIASCTNRSTALLAAVTTRIGLSEVLPSGSKLMAKHVRHKPSFPALRLSRPVTDRAVSVIIPTRNQGRLLQAAVDSLIDGNPGFDLDILIVDNASNEDDALAVLDRLESQGARILEYNEGFNFSLINNLAAEHAKHAQLCFMNNDVVFLESGVLAELCSRLIDPQVGAAGPLMTRSSDIIQHGGVVLGPWHGAVHAFEDRMFGDPGYGEMLRVASEPSAVTGAFLLTRRALFEKFGGFDEHLFSVNFNDVDYCLRLGAEGYRIVLSPHVRIEHLESVSRGREAQNPAGLRMQREVANLRARWRDVLLNDPQFHPLFAIDCPPYRALAISHRARAARRASACQPSTLPTWI